MAVAIQGISPVAHWPLMEAAPLRRTAVDKGPPLLAQRVLQPLRYREHMVTNRHGLQGLVQWQDILEELDSQAIGH
jgi:hypothetical protein